MLNRAGFGVLRLDAASACAPINRSIGGLLGVLEAGAEMDLQVARAVADGSRLQAEDLADRIAEVAGVRIAEVERDTGQVVASVDTIEEAPRPLPGPVRAEGNVGAFLEQVQEARSREVGARGALVGARDRKSV